MSHNFYFSQFWGGKNTEICIMRILSLHFAILLFFPRHGIQTRIPEKNKSELWDKHRIAEKSELWNNNNFKKLQFCSFIIIIII